MDHPKSHSRRLPDITGRIQSKKQMQSNAFGNGAAAGALSPSVGRSCNVQGVPSGQSKNATARMSLPKVFSQLLASPSPMYIRTSHYRHHLFSSTFASILYKPLRRVPVNSKQKRKFCTAEASSVCLTCQYPTAPSFYLDTNSRNHSLTSLIQQQVLRLDVSVDNVQLVKVLECPGELEDVLCRYRL